LIELLAQPLHAARNPPKWTVWHCPISAAPEDRLLTDVDGAVREPIEGIQDSEEQNAAGVSVSVCGQDRADPAKQLLHSQQALVVLRRDVGALTVGEHSRIGEDAKELIEPPTPPCH
jgi:hypothetical protein